MTGFLKKKNVTPLAVYDGVAEGLKEIYKKKLLPLEKDSKFHEIQSRKKVLFFVKILVLSHSVIHLPVRVCPPSVESPLISHSKSVSIATDLWGSL